MRFVYNISVSSYSLFIKFAALFNPKAKLWVNGRKDWESKLKMHTHGLQNIHWFHCASLGEFEQGKPLIEALKKKDPSISILVTFFSPSGYEIRKDYELADYVCYLPIDSKQNAIRFINTLDLKQAYFIKYEFWYYYFKALSDKKIPFYIVSAVFREDQVFFKWYGKWYKNILTLPTDIFVQDKESLAILNNNNLNGIHSGDTRYDRVNLTAQNPKNIPYIKDYKDERLLLIAGSSWEKEEDILCDIHLNNVQLIIAPHDISITHINIIKGKFTDAVLYSSWKDNPSDFDVLIIDSIGILSNLYQYGDVAFIGGGYSNALHNILEPACFGLPVCFGNNHTKYREAKDILNNGVAYEILNANNIDEVIFKYHTNPKLLIEDKNKNNNFILNRTGATQSILDKISS